MNTRILRIGAISLLAAAIVGAPVQLTAQSTNKPAAQKKAPAAKKEAAEKKKSGHPFRGKLAELDKTAMTLKLGKSTYYVNSETKITKDGKPATLADGVVGEPVTGYAKPDEEGKMVATTVKFGAKPESKDGEKKKKTK